MSALLKKVGEWQLEATRENMSGLFYPIPELDTVLSGNRIYVIGRKGTGKTAIAEHIMSLEAHDIFKDKLSFKDFPFHYLYSLRDSSYGSQSEYISLWKFVIYGCLAKMLVQNSNIDAAIRSSLEQRFPVDPHRKFSNILSNWISRAFGATVFGTGGSYSETKQSVNSSKWRDELDAISDLSLSCIDDASYYVLFDELDDDYREIRTKDALEKYLSLVVGLIKAADLVRDEFKARGKIVVPVVFLRSDIFDLISDNSKNKWSDLLVVLDWRKDRLQRMLAHRIAVSDNKAFASSFISQWRKVFTGELIDIGDKQIELFDYMNFRTNARPRDHIAYVRQCARVAYERGDAIISGRNIIAGEQDYSNYFRQEVIDELGPIMPQIQNILRVLSKLNKGTFRAEEFYTIFEKMNNRGELGSEELTFSPPQILDILFRFDVVGNKTSSGHNIFHHSNPMELIDYDRPIVVHVGLLRSLQIGDPRRAVPVPRIPRSAGAT